LWGALRALEESAELRRRMADRLRNAPNALNDMRGRYERDAHEAEARAGVLRELLGDEHLAKGKGNGNGRAKQTAAQRRAKGVRAQSVKGLDKVRSKRSGGPLRGVRRVVKESSG
jgi:hypothetical protein